MTCTHCNKPADDCDCETMAGIYEAATVDKTYVLLERGLYLAPRGGYTGRLEDARWVDKKYAANVSTAVLSISALPLSLAPRHAPKCDPHVIAFDLQADAAKAFEAERAARLAAEAERDRLREVLEEADNPDTAWFRSLSDKQLAEQIHWLRAMFRTRSLQADLERALAEQGRRAMLSPAPPVPAQTDTLANQGGENGN